MRFRGNYADEPCSSALAEVQATLQKYIDIKDKASEMYKKNLSLALLETTFRLPAMTVNPNHDDGVSPRVVQIGLFLDQYFERLSAFDDVKGYMAELGFDEIAILMDGVLPGILDEVSSFHCFCDGQLTQPRMPTSRAKSCSARWSTSSATSSPPAPRPSLRSPSWSTGNHKTNPSSADSAITQPPFRASTA